MAVRYYDGKAEDPAGGLAHVWEVPSYGRLPGRTECDHDDSRCDVRCLRWCSGRPTAV